MSVRLSLQSSDEKFQSLPIQLYFQDDSDLYTVSHEYKRYKLQAFSPIKTNDVRITINPTDYNQQTIQQINTLGSPVSCCTDGTDQVGKFTDLANKTINGVNKSQLLP
ncbi:unnamed protein product [Ambrosiozyma monospora]|uniref:Unnamed protein product n=1 Tax=Ambrosiozyma monospora TaxID=43982 RepID=A0A9W6YVR0_AMBMO|nr:unnamed protein product [Ambrosiozyma monospora]